MASHNPVTRIRAGRYGFRAHGCGYEVYLCAPKRWCLWRWTPAAPPLVGNRLLAVGQYPTRRAAVRAAMDGSITV